MLRGGFLVISLSFLPCIIQIKYTSVNKKKYLMYFFTEFTDKLSFISMKAKGVKALPFVEFYTSAPKSYVL